MKKLWVSVTPYEKKLVTAALESGAEAVVVPDGKAETVRDLGRIRIIAKDGDLVPGRDIEFVDIKSKADEEKAAAAPANKIVVLRMLDWTIIPIENLLAKRGKNLIVQVADSEQARLMIEILEKGVDGVLLNSTDVNEIRKTAEVLQGVGDRIELVEATITAVKQLGMGDRSCLDTCTQMSAGEGMLVGNTSSGFFLVHSESIKNPYVAARPFRVNAGGIHAYTLTPGGGTMYLTDLKAGDEVMIVDYKGKSQIAYLGRNKIEKRPMMLVEAQAGGKTISLVMQNAETMRLVSPKGEPISITLLKPDDKVLVHLEQCGRHFGMKVDETLIER